MRSGGVGTAQSEKADRGFSIRNLLPVAGLTLALPAALSACGEHEDPRPPAGISAGEAQAIEDAASMLDERRLPATGAENAPTPDTSGKP